MSYISLAQAFDQWRELSAGIPKDDAPALAESWNVYTDSLAKDGELCALQYHYAPPYDDPMPGHGSRFNPLRDDIAHILDALGVTLAATFVPFSVSRNKDEKEPSLNWRVTLRKGGRDVIATDYMHGCGHCPAYKNPPLFPNSQRVDEYEKRKRIAQECETGKHARLLGASGAPIEAPELADVFYSLLSDASAIDCRDFSDWCDEYGFSDDSIKARESYDACLQIALKLRGAFGEKTLAELRELFSEY